MVNTPRRRRRRRMAEEADHLGSELSGNLPGEIILEILARLPLKSLSHFRWVCKSWYNSITTTQFAITHHLNSLHSNTSPCVLLRRGSNFAFIDHQPFDDHQIHDVGTVNLNLKEFETTFPQSRINVLGSINGLVCFCTATGIIPTMFYVCNPITQEHVILPKSPASQKIHETVRFGFGFDSGSNQYKVIRICSKIFTFENFESCLTEAEIYTLGSGTWRRIENVPYASVDIILGLTEAGSFANGSLHWYTLEIEAMQTPIILSFDLATEEFGVIRGPPDVNSNIGFKCLNVMENQLCVANLTLFGDEIHIWIMKDYGVDGSWSRQYVLRTDRNSDVVLFPFEITKVKNGKLLLLGYKLSWIMQPSPHPLHCYDSRTKMVTPVAIQSDRIFHEAIVFRGSLLSPKCI